MVKITQWIRDVPTPYSFPWGAQILQSQTTHPQHLFLPPPPPHILSVLQTGYTSTNIQLPWTFQILLNTCKRNPSNKSLQCPGSNTTDKILKHEDINLCLQVSLTSSMGSWLVLLLGLKHFPRFHFNKENTQINSAWKIFQQTLPSHNKQGRMKNWKRLWAPLPLQFPSRPWANIDLFGKCAFL